MEAFLRLLLATPILSMAGVVEAQVAHLPHHLSVSVEEIGVFQGEGLFVVVFFLLLVCADLVQSLLDPAGLFEGVRSESSIEGTLGENGLIVVSPLSVGVHLFDDNLFDISGLSRGNGDGDFSLGGDLYQDRRGDGHFSVELNLGVHWVLEVVDVVSLEVLLNNRLSDRLLARNLHDLSPELFELLWLLDDRLQHHLVVVSLFDFEFNVFSIDNGLQDALPNDLSSRSVDCLGLDRLSNVGSPLDRVEGDLIVFSADEFEFLVLVDD